MPAYVITIEGRESAIDTDNLMLSELEVLEEFAGIDIDTLGTAASLKSMRMIGHLLWLIKLREIAAEQSIPLVKAAALHPRADFDVAVGGLQIRQVQPPKDPSPVTPITRTPPTASSRPRARSAKSATERSAGSPRS